MDNNHQATPQDEQRAPAPTQEQEPDLEVKNSYLPFRKLHWLSKRTALTLGILLAVVAVSTGIALAVAGPFGENLEDVAALEEFQSVATGDEPGAAESLQAPVSPQTPSGPASPATGKTPQSVASPDNSLDKKEGDEARTGRDDSAANADEGKVDEATSGSAASPSVSEEGKQQNPPVPAPEAEKPTAPAVDDSEPDAVDTEPDTIEIDVVVDGSAAGSDVWTRSVTLDRGSTAYDALVATGVDINARATVYGMYVASIGGLAEKDFGPLSGWVYAVDGTEPNVAASGMILHDHQRLVWTYVNVE